MPATARLSRRHAANRSAAARDMANRLLAEELGARMSEIVDAVIARAGELDPEGWTELGRRAGHYRSGAGPAGDTAAEVVRLLTSMRPAEPPSDAETAEAFAGLPT